MKQLLVGVIVAAVLGGCGGSDSEDDGSPRPTRTEFVRQIDALCNEANPELAQIRTEITQARDAGRAGRVTLSKTLETFAVLLRRASAVTERFETRLRELEAPRAERAFYKALVDSVEASSANLGQQVRAADARDASMLSNLSVQSTLIDRERTGLIRGHGGFKVCGRG